jgi:hypothetical protein
LFFWKKQVSGKKQVPANVFEYGIFGALLRKWPEKNRFTLFKVFVFEHGIFGALLRKRPEKNSFTLFESIHY